MAAKLKDLTVSSVDLVARGANQDAHIRLFKKKDDGTEEINKPVLKSISDFLQRIFSDEKPDSLQKHNVVAECGSYIETLGKSMESIINDGNSVEQKKADMLKSIYEFSETMIPTIEKWCSAESDDAGEGTPSDDINKTKEKDGAEMAIDMSKLTPEEQEMYKSLTEKAGGKLEEKEDTKKSGAADDGADKAEKHDDVAKAADDGKEPKESDVPESVQKALDTVQDLVHKAELNDMEHFAKKYEVLGQDTGKLAKDLLELKKSNSAVYDSTVALLDSQVDMVEKSGLFKEIGKSGAGSAGEGKAETLAKSLMEKDSSLTVQQAMAKAFETHPELISEYDK